MAHYHGARNHQDLRNELIDRPTRQLTRGPVRRRQRPDSCTNADPLLETRGVGSNRRLSPILGFPAMTVPAGFTSDGLPVGIEFLARPFAEPPLFKFAYAYEQGTRHRKPPASTPALRESPDPLMCD